MLPFDWKAPVGYLVAWFFEVVATCGVNIALTMTYCLIFASAWLFITITAEDLSQKLTIFNIDVKSSRRQNHDELKESFCDIIWTYSSTKE